MLALGLDGWSWLHEYRAWAAENHHRAVAAKEYCVSKSYEDKR